MQQCNRCDDRKCKKLRPSKFPVFRGRHKLGAKEMRKSCFKHQPPKATFKLHEVARLTVFGQTYTEADLR